MISNYEIKSIQGTELLFIYLDNNYEFAKINSSKDKRNLKKQILDFIKKNNIKFKGTTIALVTSGLIIGNLFLNKTDDLNLNNSIISININPDSRITEVITEEKIEEKDIKQEDIINLTQEKNNTNNIINETKKYKSTQAKSETQNLVKEEKRIETKEEVNKETDNNTTITVFRSNGTILNLELEDYLINVVAAEMPASFDAEALKSQAVLARTYAMKAIKKGRTLTDTVTTQAYKDNNELKTMWGNDFNKYYTKVKQAVDETAGETLKYDNEEIEAVYHSTSNGLTEDAANVWGKSYPYLIRVVSNVDKNVKNYEVINNYSYEKLSNMLGFIVNEDTEFNIEERNESNRVSKVSIDTNSYTGVVLRSILNLRSADFEFEKVENGINIKTRGYGHGVGMSQYGANEMAKQGHTYKTILNHYYPGTVLSKD